MSLKLEVETGEIKEPLKVGVLKPHYFRQFAENDYLIPIDKISEFDEWSSEYCFHMDIDDEFDIQDYDQYLIEDIESVKLFIQK